MARKPTFGQVIRTTRRKRGLTAAEVAERVGVSVAAIYMWETDRGRPLAANLSALCRVLKLPIRATEEMAAG
jgi:transcriptional regulator with XRE-family HTH domain